jgi:hypothetical protein
MPIPKTPVSWPLTGGLDTNKSPLSIQPGSHLTLDNLVQERLNEWRRRNGFTSDALDLALFPGGQLPYFVGGLGATGMFTVVRGGTWTYNPNGAATHWVFSGVSGSGVGTPTGARRRTPIADTDVNQVGFAQIGDTVAVATVNGATSQVAFTDKSTRAILATVTGNWLVARGAALGTKLLMFFVDSAGVLGVVSFDTTTGVATTTASLKTGLHATTPWLDARYYDDGGSTVTVVARRADSAVVYLEYNPATGALATNTTVGAVSCSSTLSLLVPPPGNATARRYVASATGGITRVTVVTSAGAVVVDDLVEAVGSTQITGVSTGGSDWSVVYRSTTPNLRTNSKTSGVIGSPVDLNYAATWGTTGYIDSQAWFDTNIEVVNWSFIIGLHSQNTDDPQDTWVELTTWTIAGQAAYPVAVIESLAAAPKLTYPQALYQVQRTGDGRFSTVLPVQVIYEDNAGTIVRHYVLTMFEQNYLQQSDVGTDPTGKPAQIAQTAFVPSSQLSAVTRGNLERLGTYNPPRILAGTSTSGGSLTSSAQYGYVAVEELIDGDGNVWRSPPSVPFLITLGPTDTKVTLTYSSWAVWHSFGVTRRVAIFRTNANGSSYRRITSSLTTPIVDIVFIDTLSDDAADEGEVLYTIGELATAITPAARAIWFHDDRMFIINAEYPTEVWYTKNLRPGRQPEFTNEGITDQDDEFGECTNGAHLDDKAVLFKKNAIYFSQGEGFTDSGSGNNYTWVQIDGDVGAIEGSPVVTNGKKVWFVSERGIYAVDKQGNVDFDGDAVSQYLNQPLVQARETVYDGVFLPSSNEVVFVTTNYLLIRNLTFNTWTRWTGLSGFRRALVIDGRLVLFRNDGTVWRQGDETQLTDQGTAFTGVIRSPWIRPAQGPSGPGTASTATTGQQGLRVYSGRVIYTRTAGGSAVNLVGRIYRNNDDAQVETFNSDAIDGSVLSATGEMKPKDQKCTAFSLELVLPSGDVTVRVDGFAAVVGVRDGALAVDNGQRWRP